MKAASRKRAELTRTAHHEAGHAVLAHFLGVGVQRVTIAGDHDSVASANSNEWSNEAEDLKLRRGERNFWVRLATARYAGAEAVKRLQPRSNWKAGAEGDYNEAWEALQRCADDLESLKALKAYARRRARVLVARHWPEIGRLAKVLLKRKTLNGAAVVAVLSK